MCSGVILHVHVLTYMYLYMYMQPGWCITLHIDKVSPSVAGMCVCMRPLTGS